MQTLLGYVAVCTSVGLLLAGCAGKTPVETVESVMPCDNDLACFATAPVWLPAILAASLITPTPRREYVSPTVAKKEEERKRLEEWKRSLLEERRQVREAYQATPLAERTLSDCLEFCDNFSFIPAAFCLDYGPATCAAVEHSYNICIARECRNPEVPFKE